LREKLFKSDVTHNSQVDVETEFGVVKLTVSL